MKKSTTRNVYALRGTPFVLVCGHRLYARSEHTAAGAGQKLVCSKPVVSGDSMTVKVLVGEDKVETFGGNLGSEYVERPVCKAKAPLPRYALVHPTCGILFA